MKRKFLVLGSVAIMSVALVIYGQTAAPPRQAASAGQTAGSAKQASSSVAVSGAAQHKLIDQYCVTCHNADDQAGNLMLDKADIAHVNQDAQTWEKVVRKMRAGMMPPAGQPRPDKATYQGLISWLENELDRTAVTHLPSPGAHRLNRTEYANAINDLLGFEIDPAKYLPSDDSSNGFDNMAGSLGLSSTLVEAYVSAAGKISRLAMGEPTTPSLIIYRVPEDTSQDYHVEGLPFGTRGGMLVDHIFPSDGDYNLSIISVFGDNMAGGNFGTVAGEKIEILMDGERVKLLDWQSGRGGGAAAPAAAAAPAVAASGVAPATDAAALAAAAQVNSDTKAIGTGGMQASFKVTAGPHKIGVTFLAANFAPVPDLNQHFMRDTIQTGPTPGFTFFPHVGSIRLQGPYGAKPTHDSVAEHKIFVCRPTGAADETACAKKIISNLASQAFRHPATVEDVNGLMAFYQSGRKEGDFDHAIEMSLARLLAAPKFIYRLEAEPANVKEGQPYRISDIDLASRLSYFLWSAGPDTELRTLASQGKLKDPVVLEQQTRRMLKDPKAESLAVNFAGQWLNLRGMQAVGPLPLIYPDFDDPLRQAMRREVELLFDNIVRDDHNVVDLLTADYTFVNERLAKHYGIPNVYGSQFRRVTLGPDMDVRRGLLGKGAILTTSSKPERTSPVSRGKWVMTNILGMSPPDPPPNVPPLPPRANDSRGTKEPSMRDKMLGHRVAPSCIQCHSLMDPIGFSLENFDGIGLWRTEDAGNPIPSSETVFDGSKVSGPAGLRSWLLGYQDQFVEVTGEKLLTYALGRKVDYQDMPLVRSIARDAAKNGNRFSALVLAVVKSKPFQMNTKLQTSIQTKDTKKEGK